jgi:hypothetical protein
MKTEEKSRSQHIREYLLSVKPSQRGPTAVVQALKEKGISVTVNHVGMVKLALRGKSVMKRKANGSGRSGRAAMKNSGLIIARDLLKSCDGNLDNAWQNLQIVAKLLKG